MLHYNRFIQINCRLLDTYSSANLGFGLVEGVCMGVLKMLAVVDDLVATPGDRGGRGAMVGTVRAPVGPPGARLLDDLLPADMSMGAKVPFRRIFSDIFDV